MELRVFQRRLVVLGSLILLVLAMSIAAHAEDVVVTFAHVHGDPLAAEWEKAISVFEEQNPGIQVEYEVISWPGDDLLRTRALGNSLPDVFYLAPWSIPTFAEAGFIADMTPYMERDGIGIDDFIGPLTIAADDAGRVWALPYDTNGFFVFYNIDHFQAAGFATPAPNDWTHAEFQEYARKLTQDHNGDGTNDRFGMAGIHSGWFSEVYLANFGARFVNSDDTFTVDTPEMKSGLEFWRGMVENQLLGPNGWQAGHEKFIDGDASMAFADSGGWVKLTADQIGSPWGAAMLPAEPGVTRESVAMSGLIVMSNQSEHPDETWKFMNFITGPQAQAMRASVGMFPARLSALQNWIEYLESGVQASGGYIPQGFENIVNSVQIAREPSYLGPKFLSYDGEINKNVSAYWNGEMSLAQTIANIDNGMNAVKSSE